MDSAQDGAEGRDGVAVEEAGSSDRGEDVEVILLAGLCL